MFIRTITSSNWAVILSNISISSSCKKKLPFSSLFSRSSPAALPITTTALFDLALADFTISSLRGISGYLQGQCPQKPLSVGLACVHFSYTLASSLSKFKLPLSIMPFWSARWSVPPCCPPCECSVPPSSACRRPQTFETVLHLSGYRAMCGRSPR